MTVKDVRTILHNIYSNKGECSKSLIQNESKFNDIQNDHNKENYVSKVSSKCKIRKHSFMVNIKHKKSKDNSTLEDNDGHSSSHTTRKIFCSSPFISTSKSNFYFNLKQTFCNIFRSRKSTSTDLDPGLNPTDTVVLLDVTKDTNFEKRALPPVPDDDLGGRDTYERETSMDFATSIEKVKDVSIIYIFILRLLLYIYIYINNNFSMDGIGDQYRVKLLKKYCQMNLMDHLLYVTVVMIIIYFP